MKFKLGKLGFYFHFYRDWRSYALCIMITAANSSIQVGPFWFSVAYPDYDW